MALVVGENTYSTLAESNEYFSTRYNSADWNSLDDSTKEILKQSATRALDLYCDWIGEKYDFNQKLEFPRNSNGIPEEIKIAENEICFSILESESVSNESVPSLQKMKADVVELIFNVQATTTSSLYSDFTKRLLSNLCFSAGSRASKRLTRV